MLKKKLNWIVSLHVMLVAWLACASVFILFLGGCATLSKSDSDTKSVSISNSDTKKASVSKLTLNTATIKIKDTGVDFITYKPASMSMKKDGVEYSYDSKAESLISKIMSVLTLGLLGESNG